MALSKTHVASARIEGVTADIWVRRHILAGTPAVDVVWIDEIGQVDVGLWAQLGKLAFLAKPPQFLLSGDPNQFGPIGNSWRSAVVSDQALWQSRFLLDLCGGKRLQLTACRRSDARLFEAYSALPHCELSLARYRELFPPSQEPSAHNLVISHRMRLKINARENARLAPLGAKFVRATQRQATHCAAQNMLLWPGLTLLGCLQRTRKGVRNGAPYTVASCDEAVRFEELPEAFPYEEVAQLFRLSHAQTYASCQGTEFHQSLTLWEVDHPMFTWRHLFVGLSRAQEAAQVHIAAPPKMECAPPKAAANCPF